MNRKLPTALACTSAPLRSPYHCIAVCTQDARASPAGASPIILRVLLRAKYSESAQGSPSLPRRTLRFLRTDILRSIGLRHQSQCCVALACGYQSKALIGSPGSDSARYPAWHGTGVQLGGYQNKVLGTRYPVDPVRAAPRYRMAGTNYNPTYVPVALRVCGQGHCTQDSAHMPHKSSQNITRRPRVALHLSAEELEATPRRRRRRPAVAAARTGPRASRSCRALPASAQACPVAQVFAAHSVVGARDPAQQGRTRAAVPAGAQPHSSLGSVHWARPSTRDPAPCPGPDLRHWRFALTRMPAQ